MIISTIILLDRLPIFGFESNNHLRVVNTDHSLGQATAELPMKPMCIRGAKPRSQDQLICDKVPELHVEMNYRSHDNASKVVINVNKQQRGITPKVHGRVELRAAVEPSSRQNQGDPEPPLVTIDLHPLPERFAISQKSDLWGPIR